MHGRMVLTAACHTSQEARDGHGLIGHDLRRAIFTSCSVPSNDDPNDKEITRTSYGEGELESLHPDLSIHDT